MMTTHKNIQWMDLGLRPYQEVWDLQEQLFDQIVQQKKRLREGASDTPTANYLITVEHPPVYTLGKSGDMAHLLLNEDQLAERGIQFYKINRGGDITFHGPGQLVGYPILNLDYFFTDIHKYLRLLEESIILTIAEYGLTGTRSTGETGVWLDIGTPFARKICAMGVRASRWVTMHGFALNVNVNLGYFDHIIPCGIRGKGVTSMAVELGRNIPLEEVNEKIRKHMAVLFEADFTQG